MRDRHASEAASLEVLELELTTLAGHLNAGNYRFLQLLAAIDHREGYAGVKIASCAHWLSWKCGIGLVAAREKVRVARALEGLPLISDAMRTGKLSYCKARAITRVATSVNVLSALEQPSSLWESDPAAARESMSASISLLLRLTGRDPDPTRSRDHVVLSVFAERRLQNGEPADVASLLDDVRKPPIETIGAMPMDEFLPKKDRMSLATALNTLLASPTFESWRTGAALDVAAWVAPRPDRRTPAIIVSVAHLDDDERALVLGILLDQLLAWVRTLTGTQRLRALLVFDEVYGFVPPQPSNPPTKRPIVSLMKQARAFGLGVILATQNPMDLDYRALSNAGVWCVGRLQNAADRQRVVEALRGGAGAAVDAVELARLLKQLAPRWFVLRNVHQRPAMVLMQSRTTLCWLRGPMTRGDLKRAMQANSAGSAR